MKTGKFSYIRACVIGRIACAVASYIILIVLCSFPNEERASLFRKQSRDIVPTGKTMSAAGSKKLGFSWYIQSGQWRADVRSLTAVLHYVTDVERSAHTNDLPVRAKMDQPCDYPPSLIFPLALLTEPGSEGLFASNKSRAADI